MKFSVFLLLISLITGCASPSTSTISAINPRVAAMKEKAEKLRAQPVLAAEISPVVFSDASWIPLRRVQRSERELANSKLNSIQIEINQRFTSLNDVVGAISSLTSLPVAVESDVNLLIGKAPTNSPLSLPLPTGPMPGGLPPSFPPAGGPSAFPGAVGLAATPTGAITAYSPFTANYAGSLTGFMNIVSAYYGISWKVEASGVRFFVMDSKTFVIAALPGDTRLNSSVEATSNASAGGSGGATQAGASTNSTGVGFTGLSVWTALESAIKQMLSSGGRVVASPATGTITVTDTPGVIARVTDFINDQNQMLNRQVTVNVQVLSVEITDGDDYGINWDAVYANLAAASNPYSIALKTAFPVATGSGNLILSAPSTSASRWAGSNAMISALSTQGRVSELTSATLVTLNNQPAPVNVGRRTTFLAASSTTQTPNVGAITTQTPGIVQTGFSMTLIPHIIDHRELLLQYSIDISSLLQLKTIDSGTGSSIQAPDISTSNFIQRVRLQSGETLVVAGFDQDNLSAVANGIGSAQNPLLGTRNGNTKRSILVVMIQPNLAH